MKSWIKYGLAGALILVASFWGGSVRAAEVQLTQDGIVVLGQINTGSCTYSPADPGCFPRRFLFG